MSFEKFLQFWTIYNRQIIEFVFVFTFVLILIIIYRQFFAKTELAPSGNSQGNSVSIDTSEIEEKLKKILENQSVFKTPQPDLTRDGSKAIAGDDGKTAAEIEKLKVELKEKEKAIEDLKKNAGKASAATNVGKDDQKKWEEKVKELESRLQEYEIISEDIADLSFYKEENSRLQKELGAKAGVPPSASIAAVPAAAPVSTPPPAAAPVASPVVIVAPALTAAPEPGQIADLTATTGESALINLGGESGSVITISAGSDKKQETDSKVVADTVVDAAANSLGDDDILKEFAAAVEGQKASVNPQAAPALPDVDPQKLNESKDLMGEFENFIKKG